MSALKKYRVEVGPDFLSSSYGRLRTARAKYSFAVDGGAIATIVPADNETIPANAILLACYINSTGAVLASGGAANVSVGIVGTAVDTLLLATAKASYSANAVLVGIPTPAVPVKITAAGKISLTPDTHAVTAGIVEVVVVYYLASA